MILNIRKKPLVISSNFIAKIGLIILAMFIITGNLTRFDVFRLSASSEPIPLGEILVYFLSTFGIFIRRVRRIFLSNFVYIALIFLFSYVWGNLNNGFSVQATAYFLRLILYLASSSFFCWSLVKIFGLDIMAALEWFSKIYLITFLLAIIIFVIFPNSNELWIFLQSYGIFFYGDGHHYRIIGGYFDPNYYAAIAVFQFALAFILTYFYRSVIGWLGLFSSLAVIVLSVSRSGLGSIAIFFVVLSLFLLFSEYLRKNRIKINKSIFYLIGILLIASPVFQPTIDRTVSRISSIGNDNSAQVRFDSFDLGNELFNQSPLFGQGYNYLYVLSVEKRGLTSLDSSLQSTLVNLGVVGTALLVIISLLAFHKNYRKSKNNYELSNILSILSIYILITVVFTSQFNNVLYYQFWLIPILTIMAYLGLCIRNTDIDLQ